MVFLAVSKANDWFFRTKVCKVFISLLAMFVGMCEWVSFWESLCVYGEYSIVYNQIMPMSVILFRIGAHCKFFVKNQSIKFNQTSGLIKAIVLIVILGYAPLPCSYWLRSLIIDWLVQWLQSKTLGLPFGPLTRDKKFLKSLRKRGPINE